MDNRYRVKIPDMVRREDAKMICIFESLDGEELKTYGSGNPAIDSIPSDWLEEIKDEPVSAEDYEAVQRIDGNRYNMTMAEICIRSFKAGEANNELRHRPKQTYREWWEKQNRIILFSTGEEIWQAAERNRGHND